MQFKSDMKCHKDTGFHCGDEKDTGEPLDPPKPLTKEGLAEASQVTVGEETGCAFKGVGLGFEG